MIIIALAAIVTALISLSEILQIKVEIAKIDELLEELRAIK